MSELDLFGRITFDDCLCRLGVGRNRKPHLIGLGCDHVRWTHFEKEHFNHLEGRGAPCPRGALATRRPGHAAPWPRGARPVCAAPTADPDC